MASTTPIQSSTESTPSAAAWARKLRMSLGRQPPPNPSPACRYRLPIRGSMPIASPSSVTSAPGRVAQLGHRVDEADLRGQVRVRRRLDQFRRGEVAHQPRNPGAQQRLVDGIQRGRHAAAPPRLRAQRRRPSRPARRTPAGPAPASPSPRCPAAGTPGSSRAARPAARPGCRRACRPCPPGTVDLPTTAAPAARCGRRLSVADTR